VAQADSPPGPPAQYRQHYQDPNAHPPHAQNRYSQQP
jgi:hypothetical protein